jgi:hypothetical protein
MFVWEQRSLEQENRQRNAPLKDGGKRLLASNLKCHLAGRSSNLERSGRSGVPQDRDLASSLKQ